VATTDVGGRPSGTRREGDWMARLDTGTKLGRQWVADEMAGSRAPNPLDGVGWWRRPSTAPLLALLRKIWEERARKLRGALKEREEEGGEPSIGWLAPSRLQQGSARVFTMVTNAQWWRKAEASGCEADGWAPLDLHCPKIFQSAQF
jgi:hypothetical protein